MSYLKKISSEDIKAVDTSKGKTSKPDKTMMWCECCEQKVKRWDIEMVEPDPILFAVNQLDPTIQFNFACPTCVTELPLVPMQTEQAKEFRARNQAWRDAVQPQILN